MRGFEPPASASRTLRSSQTEPHPVVPLPYSPTPADAQAFFQPSLIVYLPPPVLAGMKGARPKNVVFGLSRCAAVAVPAPGERPQQPLCSQPNIARVPLNPIKFPRAKLIYHELSPGLGCKIKSYDLICGNDKLVIFGSFALSASPPLNR